MAVVFALSMTQLNEKWLLNGFTGLDYQEAIR
jgi:hypothetical protein